MVPVQVTRMRKAAKIKMQKVILSSQIKAALLLVTSFTRAYAQLEKSTHHCSQGVA